MDRSTDLSEGTVARRTWPSPAVAGATTSVAMRPLDRTAPMERVRVRGRTSASSLGENEHRSAWSPRVTVRAAAVHPLGAAVWVPRRSGHLHQPIGRIRTIPHIHRAVVTTSTTFPREAPRVDPANG